MSRTVIVVGRQAERELSGILETMGYSVVSYLSPVKALNELVELENDVVIVDLKMIEMDGIKFLKKYKEKLLSSPVIIISNLYDINTVRVCLKNGAFDYLTKPVNIAELQDALDRAFETTTSSETNKKVVTELEHVIEQMGARLKEQYIHAVYGLVKILEHRDQYTEGHSRKVSELAVRIGLKLGLTKTDTTRLKISGLLHDVGKLCLADAILKKPAPLSKEEYDIVKKHPTLGAQIVSNFLADEEIIKNIRYHHEWWNGEGYPFGREGTKIPLGARIISVADAYDAMASPRVYRLAPVNQEQVIEELVNNKGVQFDGEIVDVLLNVIEEKDLLLDKKLETNKFKHQIDMGQ